MVMVCDSQSSGTSQKEDGKTIIDPHPEHLLHRQIVPHLALALVLV
jgi:hypothetical protein